MVTRVTFINGIREGCVEYMYIKYVVDGWMDTRIYMRNTVYTFCQIFSFSFYFMENVSNLTPLAVLSLIIIHSLHSESLRRAISFCLMHGTKARIFNLCHCYVNVTFAILLST